MKIFVIVIGVLIVMVGFYRVVSRLQDCGVDQDGTRCFCEDGFIIWNKCTGVRVDITNTNPPHVKK